MIKKRRLLLTTALLSAAVHAAPHSVETMSPDIVAGIIETCASTPECRSTSLLPVTLHTGTYAHCATSSNRNTKVDTGTPAGIYLFYEISNGCGSAVVAKAKIGDEWFDAGLISPGQTSFISILYASGLAKTPTVVMFCSGLGTPQDDQNC